MSQKTDTEVIIGGKVFTLSGYESEAYLQKVASYINNKLAEYNKVDSFKRLPGDMQNVLLQLNVADDYFKAKKQIELLEEDIRNKEKEWRPMRTPVKSCVWRQNSKNRKNNRNDTKAVFSKGEDSFLKSRCEFQEKKDAGIIKPSRKLGQLYRSHERRSRCHLSGGRQI